VPKKVGIFYSIFNMHLSETIMERRANVAKKEEEHPLTLSIDLSRRSMGAALVLVLQKNIQAVCAFNCFTVVADRYLW
jgi:hypothetical protein